MLASASISVPVSQYYETLSNRAGALLASAYWRGFSRAIDW
jgi:hypothetical protein